MAAKITPNSSLLQWLATFQLDNKAAIEVGNSEAFYSLADGYICARILNQISPMYFTDKWLEGIKSVPPDGSWRLRVSNLKRILQKIYDYASDLQNSHQFRPSAINPDVTVVAQNFDPDQICRLIQLILFCAINCDKKQEYIERICDLPTQEQQYIKKAIEELLVHNNDSTHKTPTSPTKNDLCRSETELNQRLNFSSSSQDPVMSPGRISNFRGALRRDSSQSETNRRSESNSSALYLDNHGESIDTIEGLRHKLSSVKELSNEKAQACHDLELKLKELRLERDLLAFENEKLSAENSSRDTKSAHHSSNHDEIDHERELGRRASNPVDEQSQNLILAQNKRLQADLQRLKEDIIKVESEKEDYRLKSNLLKEDLDKITSRHEELQNRAELARRLQDELDEQKHISEKVTSYEAMMENLTKKNSEMKREIKNLEEKNFMHIQDIVKLEQENQRLIGIVGQIDIYKKQLSELQVKFSREVHRADMAEVDLGRLIERYNAIRKENERLLTTTNQLMSTSLSKEQKLDVQIEGEMFNPDGDSTTDRVHKLNATLTNHQGTDDLPISLGPSFIELKETIARLKVEKELLQNRLDSKSDNNKLVIEGLLEETTTKCKQLENDNRQARKRIMLLESNLKDLSNSGDQPSTSGGCAQAQDSSSDNVMALIKRIEDLQRSLYQKEQELRDLEAKYKRNIHKAKEVMRALSANQSMSGGLQMSYVSSPFNSNSLDEANLLRQQLREKEEQIISIEREFYEFKKLKEVHERLILSAFYNTATSLQWKNAERRLERTSLTSPPNTANSSINASKHSN